MKLSDIEENCEFEVGEILTTNEEIIARFFKLGILPGIKISLRRKAPLFKDPLLFDIEGSQIILTKSESELIKVKS